MLIQIRDVPAAATTHSEIQDTTLPSTFSNFMVKMLWLQEKAVWIFSRSRQTGSRSSWMLLTSCWRTGSSLWLRRSCSCSRAAGFCRPRPNSGHWPTWDLEKRNGIRQTVSHSAFSRSLSRSNLWRKRSRRRHRKPGATPVSWTWSRATAAAGRTPARCRFRRTPPTVWTGSRSLLLSHWWDLKRGHRPRYQVRHNSWMHHSNTDRQSTLMKWKPRRNYWWFQFNDRLTIHGCGGNEVQILQVDFSCISTQLVCIRLMAFKSYILYLDTNVFILYFLHWKKKNILWCICCCFKWRYLHHTV